MTDVLQWNFDNSYGRLPDSFYTRQLPTRVREPQLAVFNGGLAETLGITWDGERTSDIAAQLAGNVIPDGADPLAQAYAGCQFGHFTFLGDGRAILLGEQIAPNGQRFDIQFKGSGRTRYSRGGDGRAALGPMLREYIISEAMAALGIPTTRSLGVVATGEPVHRDRPLPGAVLTRVAASHLRVGTFEYFSARRDVAGLRTLADYAIQRHYSHLAETEHRYLGLLEAVLDRQVELVVRWLSVGFVHGVMNTDNMSIAGETIDYGPCAFLDTYHPETVFSSIDHQGRYAFGNQPAIAQWNLARLAESLLPIMRDDPREALEPAIAVIRSFTEKFERRWLQERRAKLGLMDEEPEDKALADDLLLFMQRHSLDWTNTWRALASDEAPRGTAFETDEFRAWHVRWTQRLERQKSTRSDAHAWMRRHNPAVIPRNHRVEEALAAATDEGDLEPLDRLLVVCAFPYESRPEVADFCDPAPACGAPYRTFCGT